MIDRKRLDDELQSLKELIRPDRAVWEFFDLGRDDSIESEPWEQVRQLVHRRLDREADEVRRASDLARTTTSAIDASGLLQPGDIAHRIFEYDLPALIGSARSSVSLATASDLVLELRQDAHGCCSILSPDGSKIGSVERRGDFDFALAGDDDSRVFLRGSRASVGQRVEILDQAGTPQGYVHGQTAPLRRSYHLVSTADRATLSVEGRPACPLTLFVRGPNRTLIGTVEREWSGLGRFLVGTDRTRIRVEPAKASAGHRWGLIATALLEEVAAGTLDDGRLAGAAYWSLTAL